MSATRPKDVVVTLGTWRNLRYKIFTLLEKKKLCRFVSSSLHVSGLMPEITDVNVHCVCGCVCVEEGVCVQITAT